MLSRPESGRAACQSHLDPWRTRGKDLGHTAKPRNSGHRPRTVGPGIRLVVSTLWVFSKSSLICFKVSCFSTKLSCWSRRDKQSELLKLSDQHCHVQTGFLLVVGNVLIHLARLIIRWRHCNMQRPLAALVRTMRYGTPWRSSSPRSAS